MCFSSSQQITNECTQWVKLAVDRINSCHRQADVEDALRELPDGMEALYDRMAANILVLPSASDKALAIAILQCLTCSVRSLKVSELAEAKETCI